MNRRSLLTAAPALALAGCALPAMAEAETPVAVLFREWAKLWARSRDLSGMEMTGDMEREQDRVEDRMIELEKAMRDTPKRDMVDVLMAVNATTNFGALTYEEEVFRPLQAEARALIAA